jgi:rare lipoprotein A
MFLRRRASLALASAIIASLIWPPALPAAALSLGDQTAADRAAVARAMEQYNAAQAASDELDAKVAAASATLDDAIVRERQCQQWLGSRAAAMYRAGDGGTLALLLSAENIQELSMRLEMLDRLARQDAANIHALKEARAQATESAEELLALQAEQAKALDAAAAEVARTREELATSEAALRDYEARVAAAAAAAAAARKAANTKANPDQGLTGTGDWQVAVASHYGLNFSGRGASGETIGPYSMIVAHRTLPFGTLVEFEYGGKRAVARVADRGPHVAGREFDLGPGVARVLGFSGVHEVRYRVLGK